MKKDINSTTVSFQLSEMASGPACIVAIYGGNIGRCHPIIHEPITIGRDQENTVALDAADVSRRHARVYRHGSTYIVEDRKSTNGVFVNDTRITTASPLANGDLIKLGGAIFKFLAGGNIESAYYEEIHRLIITDGLTRVPNRRQLTKFLEREIVRYSRHERPLSLALIDIDRFQRVNHSYGHLAGDHVLEKMAQLVSQDVRRDELFARFGGDEFAIALPDSEIADGMVAAERIRKLIESTVIEFEGEQIRITVSIGVVTLGNDQGLDELLRGADEQLIRAKREGRNRVAGAEPDSSTAEVDRLIGKIASSCAALEAGEDVRTVAQSLLAQAAQLKRSMPGAHRRTVASQGQPGRPGPDQEPDLLEYCRSIVATGGDSDSATFAGVLERWLRTSQQE